MSFSAAVGRCALLTYSRNASSTAGPLSRLRRQLGMPRAALGCRRTWCVQHLRRSLQVRRHLRVAREEIPATFEDQTTSPGSADRLGADAVRRCLRGNMDLARAGVMIATLHHSWEHVAAFREAFRDRVRPTLFRSMVTDSRAPRDRLLDLMHALSRRIMRRTCATVSECFCRPRGTGGGSQRMEPSTRFDVRSAPPRRCADVAAAPVYGANRCSVPRQGGRNFGTSSQRLFLNQLGTTLERHLFAIRLDTRVGCCAIDVAGADCCARLRVSQRQPFFAVYRARLRSVPRGRHAHHQVGLLPMIGADGRNSGKITPMSKKTEEQGMSCWRRTHMRFASRREQSGAGHRS